MSCGGERRRLKLTHSRLPKRRREMTHSLAWGETFSQAVEHLPQRSLELRDSLRAG
jgi:hypothetical protein